MVPLIYHNNYSCPFPLEHRFVMSKFVRLYDYLAKEGFIAPDRANLFVPDKASRQDLSVCHGPEYLAALEEGRVDARAWRRVGLPWSRGLIERTFTAPNGTLAAARLALETGLACHLAGGTHHAHYDFGSGFCLLNDLAYTARVLLAEGRVQKILVFDLDVHQGDGTAALLADEKRAFTCSMHCEKNFPFRKSASDLDVGLDPHLADDEYLERVEATFLHLLAQVQPDLVLYDAGVDVWSNDPLGLLDISWQGIHKRDQLVLEACLERGIPVATVIGGGYDTDHARLAHRHAIVIEVAHECWQASGAGLPLRGQIV